MANYQFTEGTGYSASNLGGSLGPIVFGTLSLRYFISTSLGASTNGAPDTINSPEWITTVMI